MIEKTIAGLTWIVRENGIESARLPVRAGPMLVGRRADVDVRVNDPAMSSVHAQVTPGPAGGLVLRDLGSRNGTYVNGRRVEAADIAPGDEIEVGRATIILSRAPAHEPLRPPVPPFEPSLSTTSKILIPLADLRKDRGGEDERLLLLRDLVESLKGVDDAERILATTRRALERAFPQARVFVLLNDRADGFQDLAAEPGAGRPPSHTVAAEAVASRSAILLTDLIADARFADAASIQSSGIETALAAPVFLRQEPVAVLYADRTGASGFAERDLRLLGIAANHVSAVLDNAAYMTDLRRANEELSATRDELAALNRDLERRVEARTLEVRRQADEIRRLAEERDELLRMAAHDLRNPLAGIQGAVELLHMNAPLLDRDSLDHVRSLRRAVSQLIPMVTGLLDAKAIESGKLVLARRRCEAREILENVSAITSLTSEARGIPVDFEADADLWLDADPRLLAEAISNLLFNAIKFSTRGTRVTVSVRANGTDAAEVAVRDQGVGIPAAEIPHLFGAFEQGGEGRKRGGSGLGLAIARTIVQLHGGHISVESAEGRGSCFSFTLPRTKPA